MTYVVLFIGLNLQSPMPKSTTQRSIGASDLRGPGITVALLWALFAYRATNPKELTPSSDPVGPENDRSG